MDAAYSFFIIRYTGHSVVNCRHSVTLRNGMVYATVKLNNVLVSGT